MHSNQRNIVNSVGLLNAPDRRQSKTLILSTNVDQKSLETEFSAAICCQSSDKWQSKTLFLAIFDPGLSIVKSVFDCRLPGVLKVIARLAMIMKNFRVFSEHEMTIRISQIDVICRVVNIAY